MVKCHLEKMEDGNEKDNSNVKEGQSLNGGDNAGNGGEEVETPSEDDPMSVVYDSTEYFESYEDLNVHRLMLQDKMRTNAYQDAILGAASLFKDKVVMDVGAGTGILSLFCAKAGAKKVYAVEASSLAKIIPNVVAKNGYEDVINVIHSRLEDIETLPDSDDQKVDIIVSEWMGFYLLHESMLDSVLKARDKFLKTGGHMFPSTAQIYAAPCTVPEIWKENVGFWTTKDNHYGFDLSSFADVARNVKKPVVEVITSESLMSDPQLLFDLNLQTIPIDSLQVFKDRRFFTIEQSGEMHAVAIWFNCTFPAVPEKEPNELSTAPWDTPTHWKQTLILLPDKLEFEEGDITGWEMSFEKSPEQNSRSYTLQYQCLDANEEHPVPCECGSVKCEIVKHYLTQNQSDSMV